MTSDDQEQPGAQPSARGLTAAVALFALGFVAVAGLLHLTVRDPLHLHADYRSEKLVMLGQLQGSVFSAAFGTSHVHNGFDPRAFDRELGGAGGIQTHSMNMAVAGGSQAEQRVMALEFVRHIQAPPRGDACLVMLELDAGANFLTSFLVHPRTIDIYDWRTAQFISHLTAPLTPAYRMSRTQRLGRLGYALAAFGLHSINLGMVSNAIFAPQLNQALVDDQMQDDRRGLLEETHGNAKLTEELNTTPRSSKAAPGMLTAGNADLLGEIQAASPRHTLDFVYFIFPKFSDLSAEPVYPDHLEVNGRLVPIINMARPSRFPQLYRIELWRDDAHLDSEGAALLSKLLADEVKTWYANHGGAPTCGG